MRRGDDDRRGFSHGNCTLKCVHSLSLVFYAWLKIYGPLTYLVVI